MSQVCDNRLSGSHTSELVPRWSLRDSFRLAFLTFVAVKTEAHMLQVTIVGEGEWTYHDS